ncbi:MAG: LLM class F420-dependent oxidoreductase [Acidimicrobiaceae bacterium]|nr:LLM class F420-dependent oxidoreductase [Acidimicrobiaceae bacterium]MYA75437.1 LLM class F420-dependent oxidoreductase [Acidimicrobiaceae bacterium]MYD05344.1 LLM class F420-dependent oxidoreductase [Acidimicrobiaceae bacterium]MYG56463.1 LLM class F420-dependent oxidoreductase [Acidimicrobiaceae bacterium]MYI57823.1 LLM class F420-dependent oxidoreductase [Acidimicrobiaceae bacterium]
MKFSVTYPLVSHPYNPELLSKESLTRFAQTAENAGFDAMGFTDHPAPTHRWLSAGGHDALDPFAALAFVAAVTDRMLLVPNIVVLPYRNPFLVAKSIATIDALSGGRFVLATGTGYLKGEYKALGVDFDERNELFDEAIEVMRGVWANDDFAYEGRNFLAHGQSANPKPGRVPLWIGGNSKLSRRRVAEVADGWVPFPAPRALAHTTKTPPLETPEDLAQMLDYLWQHVDRAGRNRSEIDVCFGTSAGGSLTDDTFDADAHIAGLTELAALGVTWASATVPGDSIDHATEALQRYGEEVIATYQAS